jgi:hypothetical protein
MFYIESPMGHRIDVIVAVSADGKSLNKCLKTIADRERTNFCLCRPVQIEALQPRLT